MPNQERVNAIMRELQSEHFVSAAALSEKLHVSVATIRRDIEDLERKGIILKKHGGVILSQDLISASAAAQRDPNYLLKERIGLRAAEMIEPNDVIFIGPGRTCMHLARNIKHKQNLIVITNSFSIVRILSDSPKLRLIFCGGDVDHDEHQNFSTGQFAVHDLGNMYINRSFLTVDAISPSFDCFINSYELAEVYKRLLDNSSMIAVLADSSKFGTRAFRLLCPASAIHLFVTNTDVPKEFIEFSRAHDIRLLTC